MSLINPKNLIAPFKNKVAVGALLVVTIIVAVGRISASHTNKNGVGAPPERVSARDVLAEGKLGAFLRKEEPSFDDPRAGFGGDQEVEAAPIDDPLLNDLLTQELTGKGARQQPKKANDNKGLSDIKRTLGLE